jgi:hypothetical protein
MQKVFSGILIFGVLLAGFQCRYVNASQKKGEEVPKDFSYPDSPKRTELKDPIRAKSLAGTIADAAGFPIPRVLVERVSPDWKTRLDATFTDSEGSFAFVKAPIGRHYLKLSMNGFDTLLVKVIASKKSKAKLKLFLNPST